MKKYIVNVNGTDYQVTLEAVKDGEDFKTAPAAEKETKPAAAGSKTVNAPMPGNILDVKTSVGAKVKAGQTVCILEAMKMENEIQASCDGTVASVNVKKGDSVKTGDVLITLA